LGERGIKEIAGDSRIMNTDCVLIHIVHEGDYSKRFDDYSDTYSRMYEVQDGIDWSLCEYPIQGFELDSEHRVIKTLAIGPLPSFWVLYRHEKAENIVHLLSITVVESED
jgi:hypothetical protein